MTIGERLRKWRKDNGLTTSEIADKTGLSTGGLSEYENDKKLIGSKTLLALYENYRIDINYILTGERNDEILDEEQAQLIQYFKLCDNDTREDIIRFVKRFAITQMDKAEGAVVEEEKHLLEK